MTLGPAYPSGGGTASLAADYTVSAKTGNYTVVAGDLGSIISVTNNDATISFDPAATLGAGFWCWVESLQTTATHETTLDPNGAETIDGVSTLILRRGERALVWCDGTNLQILGRMRGWAENISPSSTRAQASGDGAVAIQGATNAGSNCFAGGPNTQTTSGQNTFSYGNGNIVDGNYGAAFGVNQTGSFGAGDGGFMAGSNSTVSSQLGITLGSWAAATRYGKEAFATGRFPSGGAGDAQGARMMLRRATTDATPTVLTSDNAAASTSNQVILPNNTTYRVTGEVVAMQSATDGTAVASYLFVAVVRRGANAAATTLPYSSVTTEFETTAGWDLTLSADTTNGGLAITGTGAAATNIRWLCTARSTELTYA